jgi:hypothetical protein
MFEGQDKSILFIRKPESYSRVGMNPIPKSLEGFVQISIPRSISVNRGDLNVRFGYLIVAGIFYPQAMVWKRGDKTNIGLTNYIDRNGFNSVLPDMYLYDYDQLQMMLLEEYNYDMEQNIFFNRRAEYGISEFFKLKGAVVKEASIQEYPIVYVTSTLVEIDSILGKMEFYKVLDAWQCFQNLSMFIGNIASKDDTPVKISDKDRIAQYGFDKWSFRKMPS